jgi:hypothetical protein
VLLRLLLLRLLSDCYYGYEYYYYGYYYYY